MKFFKYVGPDFGTGFIMLDALVVWVNTENLKGWAFQIPLPLWFDWELRDYEESWVFGRKWLVVRRIKYPHGAPGREFSIDAQVKHPSRHIRAY